MENNEEKKNERRTGSRWLLPALLLVMLIGVAYAFWQVAITQDNPNILTTLACLDTTLTDETDAIYFTNEHPISNAAGMARDPYSFTVTNICDNPVNVDITLEVLGNSTLNHDYIRGSVNRMGSIIDNSDVMTGFDTMLPSILGATSYVMIDNVTLTPDENQTFDLRLWLDRETPYEEGRNKIMHAKIVVVASPTPQDQGAD